MIISFISLVESKNPKEDNVSVWINRIEYQYKIMFVIWNGNTKIDFAQTEPYFSFLKDIEIIEKSLT